MQLATQNCPVIYLTGKSKSIWKGRKKKRKRERRKLAFRVGHIHSHRIVDEAGNERWVCVHVYFRYNFISFGSINGTWEHRPLAKTENRLDAIDGGEGFEGDVWMCRWPHRISISNIKAMRVCSCVHAISISVAGTIFLAGLCFVFAIFHRQCRRLSKFQMITRTSLSLFPFFFLVSMSISDKKLRPNEKPSMEMVKRPGTRRKQTHTRKLCCNSSAYHLKMAIVAENQQQQQQHLAVVAEFCAKWT